MKKKHLIPLFLVLTLILIPVVFGAWSKTGESGNWDNNASLSLLSYDGWQETTWAQTNFTYGNVGSIAVGEGIEQWFTYTITGEKLEWWWTEGTKRVAVVFELQNGSETVYNWWYIAHEQLALWETSEILIGKYGRCSIGKPVLWIEPRREYDISTWVNGIQIGKTVPTINARFGFQIVRNTSTQAKVMYAFDFLSGDDDIFEDRKGGQIVWYETFNTTSTFWDNPILNIYIGHEGNGEFELKFDSTTIGTIDVFEYESPEDFELPAPISWLADGANFLVSMIQIVGSIATTGAPYLGIILLTYLVDVCITSLQQGSFTPVGVAFMKIYELVFLAYEKAIEIGTLIWDTITFWT